MRYRVQTKGGKVYKAKDVEVAFGFITMKFWHGELRLPAGEITSIKKTLFTSAESEKVKAPEKSPEAVSGGWAIPVFLFFLAFIFSLPILLG